MPRLWGAGGGTQGLIHSRQALSLGFEYYESSVMRYLKMLSQCSSVLQSLIASVFLFLHYLLSYSPLKTKSPRL